METLKECSRIQRDVAQVKDKAMLSTLFKRLDAVRQDASALASSLADYDLGKLQKTIFALDRCLEDQRISISSIGEFRFKSIHLLGQDILKHKDGDSFPLGNLSDLMKREDTVIDRKTLEDVGPLADITVKSILLKEIRACTVTLRQKLGALRAVSFDCCKVAIGPVEGPAMLTGFQDCIVLIECSQLRVHDSRNCTFYVFTTNSPVIEDCQDLRFGNLRTNRTGMNMWRDVRDFNWPRSDIPNPNIEFVKDSISMDEFRDIKLPEMH